MCDVGVAAGFICLQGHESYFYSVTCWRKVYVVQLLTTPRVSGKIADVGETCRVENLVRELVASCCLSKNIAACITLRRKTNTWSETCLKRLSLSNFRNNALDKKKLFSNTLQITYLFFLIRMGSNNVTNMLFYRCCCCWCCCCAIAASKRYVVVPSHTHPSDRPCVVFMRIILCDNCENRYGFFFIRQLWAYTQPNAV